MTRQVSILPFDQDAVQTAGTTGITYNVATAQRFNGRNYITTPANGDSRFYTRYFSKGGTYKIRFIYNTEFDAGQLSIGLDSSTSNIFSQVDEYTAGTIQNVVKETTMEISRGFHTITFLVTGKNGSSTNYYSIITALLFDLIQEYPVYQDDEPAKFQEGETVLLYKHKAAVAESTTGTINLAGLASGVYDSIIIKMTGKTTASLALQLTINGVVGTNNFQQGARTIGGSQTQINLSSQALLVLASATMLTGVNSFRASAEIACAEASFNIVGRWESDSDVLSNEFGTLALTTSTPITTILINTSTSTWQIGTTIQIYGLKKK